MDCLEGVFPGSSQAKEVRVNTTETFETGTKVGRWTWGVGTDDLVESNGNPGRYLRESYLVTYTPRASATFGVQSMFIGDYHTRNVESVGIDMAIISVSVIGTGRNVNLHLLNDTKLLRICKTTGKPLPSPMFQFQTREW